jgi:hypothetical protein
VNGGFPFPIGLGNSENHLLWLRDRSFAIFSPLEVTSSLMTVSEDREQGMQALDRQPVTKAITAA